MINRSAPPAALVPVLVYPDVRAAAAWLELALGFVERVRVGEDHRVQLDTGHGGAVILADVGADRHPPSPGRVSQLIKLRVPDVDAAAARARAHGAHLLEGPATRPYGEREATVEDPGGHRWQFTQSVEDVDPAQWGGREVNGGWGEATEP